LTAEQGLLYELILQDRNLSISQLAQKLTTNRMFIYRNLEVLENKGLLEKRNAWEKGFKPTNPSIVASLLKQKQLELNKAITNFDQYLPEILTNWYSFLEPTFKTYDSKDKFWLLFNTLIDKAPENSIIYEIGSGQDFYNIVDLDYWDNVWRPKRLKKNISGRILARNDDPHFTKSQIKTEFKRDWKFLPPSFKSIGSIWVVSNTIILWDTFNGKAFEIQNTTLANLLVATFEALWESVDTSKLV
jgi:sugar-specific transcriptional regulator TrmB